jgi:hypothetical protein
MRIPLTRDKFVVVDSEDADLAHHSWSVQRRGSNANPIWYAVRNGSRVGYGKPVTIMMHRVILERKLGRPLKKGEQTDHGDHDGLNNQRYNLNLVNPSENMQNQRIRGGVKHSQYKGVTWHKHLKKWMTQIQHGGKNNHIGYFDNEKDAAMAYDEAAKRLFGNHYTLNFPDGM